MARFVALSPRRGLACVLAAGGLAGLAANALAQPLAPAKPPTTNAPAAKAPAPNTATAKPASAKAPATNAAAAVKPPPEMLGRYGKIFVPGDEVSHPLKLKMPIPGIGEIKVPKQEELDMRMKLEALAKLSDDDIRKQLAQWPAFNHMTLRDEGAMLQRIQDFRDYRGRFAQQKAKDLGIFSTLTPEQKTKFETEYWDKRLKLDQDLAKQFRPVFQAREQKMEDELFREFSSAMPGPAAPKPPITPATNKPAPPKPVVSATVGASNSAPMAQAPR